MKKIAIYDNLKRGFGNHKNFLSHSYFLGTGKVFGFVLIGNPPVAIRIPAKSLIDYYQKTGIIPFIEVELFEITSEDYTKILFYYRHKHMEETVVQVVKDKDKKKEWFTMFEGTKYLFGGLSDEEILKRLNVIKKKHKYEGE